MTEIYLSKYSDNILLYLNGYFMFEDTDHFTNDKESRDFILNQYIKIGEFEE